MIFHIEIKIKFKVVTYILYEHVEHNFTKLDKTMKNDIIYIFLNVSNVH